MANEIITLRRAARGSGTTPMPGAVRARIVPNAESRRSQAGGRDMLTGAWKLGAAPQVVIEFEGLADVLAAVKGQLEAQTLVLGYTGAAGNRKLTIKYATAVQVGESEFPPAEGGGDVARHQVTFAVHGGTGVDTLAEAFVEAADPDDPSGTIDPVVSVQSAYRGATGTTEIPQAVRVLLRSELAVKTSRAGGRELPDRVWVTSSRPQVLVETEDSSVWLTGLSGGASDEIVKVYYQAGSGNRVLTAQWARLVGVEELPIEAAEQAGNVSRGRLVFDLVADGATITGIADALADAAA